MRGRVWVTYKKLSYIKVRLYSRHSMLMGLGQIKRINGKLWAAVSIMRDESWCFTFHYASPWIWKKERKKWLLIHYHLIWSMVSTLGFLVLEKYLQKRKGNNEQIHTFLTITSWKRLNSKQRWLIAQGL